MEANEVIIEKVILNGNANEQILNVEETNDVLNVTKNLSTPEESINDNEIILIAEKSVNKLTCNEKSNISKQQYESFMNRNYNRRFINNDDNGQGVSNDLLIENLKQNDDDIYIVHENDIALSVKSSNKLCSLANIAIEYGDSDSETESTSDFSKRENGKNIVFEEVQMESYRLNNGMSSGEESNSEDDSISSDSSIIIESNESDSDDSANKKGKKNNTKGPKNNEIKSELDDLPPIEDLTISVPEVLCDPLGKIAWMVEQLVVVRPNSGKPTLNLDTILFIEKGQRALGKIFDVFGQVSEPHYCIRFNSLEHIQKCDIKVGMNVYYCPNTEYTSLVFLHDLMKIKGIDANADEPPEFSDDEEERAYYEKQKVKQTSNTTETDIAFKRKRATSPSAGWQSNHPWNRNTQRQRKVHHPRGGKRQFSPMQTGNQSQTPWVQPYQNSWPSIPRGLHLGNNEQYGYAMYPAALQSMQYMNPNINSINQNFYNSQNYYNEDGIAVPLNPRIPFNTSPRLSLGHCQNGPNLRFRNANMPWPVQSAPTMNVPWVSLPPPPPPPPPSSSSPSSSGKN